MSPTRQVGNPFAFSRIVSTIGSRWPRTCVAIPGGSAFMSDDRVWTLTAEGPRDISQPMRHLWRGPAALLFPGVQQATLRGACMIYNDRDRSLWWHLPLETNSTPETLDAVYRYGFEISGWSRFLFLFRIQSLASADYRKGLTIGELTGTIGTLTGVIGDLGVSNYPSGALIVSGTPRAAAPTTWFVAREAPDLASTPVDVTFDGTTTSFSGTLATGTLRAGDPTRWVHLHESAVTYEMFGVGSMTLAYSVDGGVNFTTVVTELTPSAGQRAARTWRVPLNVQNRGISLRLTAGGSNTPYLRLLDWRARVTDGANIGDHA
jgi:hypothetical protein